MPKIRIRYDETTFGDGSKDLTIRIKGIFDWKISEQGDSNIEIKAGRIKKKPKTPKRS